MRFTFAQKMRKSLIGLMVCLAVVVSGATLAACGSSGGGDGDKGAVAMSFGGLEIVLWNDIINKMRPEIEEAGYEFLVDDPQFKVDKQVADWEAWIAQGNVKAIMGFPIQVDALIPVTQRAVDADIDILGYTQNWEGTTAAYLTNPVKDGEKIGRDAGEWIKKTYGDKPVEVAILTDRTTEITTGRSDGMTEAVEAAAPNAVIYDLPAFTRPEGFAAAQSQLTAHPDTKVWIGFGDEHVLGAYRAVLDSGVAPDDPGYFFGGLDATNEILDIIKIPDSIWRAGYVFPSDVLAKANSQLLLEAAEGKEPEDIVVDSVKVTAANADEYFVDEAADEGEENGEEIEEEAAEEAE